MTLVLVLVLMAVLAILIPDGCVGRVSVNCVSADNCQC